MADGTNEVVDSAVMAQALEVGWVPEDKWTGDKEKWVDAATFVKRAETMVPLLLSQNRKLRGEVKSLSGEIVQVKDDTVAFRKMLEKNAENEKKDLVEEIRQLRTDRAKAITDGDGIRAEELSEEIEGKQGELKEVKATPAAAATTSSHPEYAGWLAENRWYVEDLHLQAVANVIANNMLVSDKSLAGRALYEKVTEEVSKLAAFKRYRTPASHRTDASVEAEDTLPSTESQRVRRSGKGRSFDDLPADAKASFSRMNRDGWFSDKQGKTVAERQARYAAEYQWD